MLTITAEAVIEVLQRMETIKGGDNVFMLDSIHLVRESELSLKFSGVAAELETRKNRLCFS